MLERIRWQENTKVSEGHKYDQETSWKYQEKMESSWRANGEHILVGFRLIPKWLPADSQPNPSWLSTDSQTKENSQISLAKKAIKEHFGELMESFF